jgi:hypothetical protein
MELIESDRLARQRSRHRRVREAAPAGLA